MHTIVRFLTALRQRTDQETLEEFVILCLRRLLDREDGELRRMLVHPHLKWGCVEYQHLRCDCVADCEPFIASQKLILMPSTLQTWRDWDPYRTLCSYVWLFFAFRKLYPCFYIIVRVRIKITLKIDPAIKIIIGNGDGSLHCWKFLFQ